VLRINEHSTINWTFNCGLGTNTRAELLGVWATLTLASRLHFSKLQVFGDSEIVINWLNNKGNLNVISLDCWKERIRDIRKSFSIISFSHIYRESNKEADRLSKLVLQKQEGKIAYNHWVDGNEGSHLVLKSILVSNGESLCLSLFWSSMFLR
jgi:ribonuclease HI